MMKYKDDNLKQWNTKTVNRNGKTLYLGNGIPNPNPNTGVMISVLGQGETDSKRFSVKWQNKLIK